MDNKVVQTLARACVASGFTAVRFNFRGVGASAGSHDQGRGEAQDMLAVLRQVAAQGPLVLAGFPLVPSWPARRWRRSGTRAGCSAWCWSARRPAAAVPPVPPAAHALSLVLHGEQDDTVPLASVMDWARPQQLPVTVIPGGGHFFHGQLPLLKGIVMRHLNA